jgi:hypothetical protein
MVSTLFNSSKICTIVRYPPPFLSRKELNVAQYHDSGLTSRIRVLTLHRWNVDCSFSSPDPLLTYLTYLYYFKPFLLTVSIVKEPVKMLVFIRWSLVSYSSDFGTFASEVLMSNCRCTVYRSYHGVADHETTDSLSRSSRYSLIKLKTRPASSMV